MIALILEFYIPALLATIVLALFISLIYWLIFARRARKSQGGPQSAFHELLVLNLLVIPVVSFSILALLVVLRSLSV